ncbi:Hypothetical protein NGAL_HAMBI2605_02580 [Neorhizobium galegae bv. orientalis]|nr:Hypothetical protein NGAL_HAMBI2605_02580 [Neorhizobium galegae bv. orientalis]
MRQRAVDPHWRSSNVNAPRTRAHGTRSMLRRISPTEAAGPKRSGTAPGARNGPLMKPAALAAAGAAFLHPLAKAAQVKHILGSAAHAARAFELAAQENPAGEASHMAQTPIRPHPVVVDVLKRYPAAPTGGGRVGELVRQLDASLRQAE